MVVKTDFGGKTWAKQLTIEKLTKEGKCGFHLNLMYA